MAHTHAAAAMPSRSLGGAPMLTRTRRANTVKATQAYKPPSSATGASELEWASRHSVLVPDTVAGAAGQGTRLAAATASFPLLRTVTAAEATLGLRPLENAIAAARTYDKNPDKQVDRALANVAALLAQQVEGRVSVEVDPRLANDKAALVAKAQSLVSMCKDVGLSTSRLLMRLPATWAGISAAAELEKADVPTQLDMVHSVVQAAAAGQAGASLVNVRVGRTRDFYAKNPGLIRDPHGPRQDAGALATGVDPGIKLAADVYNYLKAHHPKTLVMASGVRTREDVLALVGIDFILCPERVMAALSNTPTTSGYNTGLWAQAEEEDGLQPQLTPAGAKAAAPPVVGKVTEASFNEGLGYAGKELLAQAVHEAVQDVEALASMARVTTGLSSS